MHRTRKGAPVNQVPEGPCGCLGKGCLHEGPKGSGCPVGLGNGKASGCQGDTDCTEKVAGGHVTVSSVPCSALHSFTPSLTHISLSPLDSNEHNPFYYGKSPPLGSS